MNPARMNPLVRHVRTAFVGLLLLTVGVIHAEEAVVAGEWKLTVQTPNGITHPVLTIVQGDAGYSGTYVGPRGTFGLPAIEVNGSTFAFPLSMEMPIGKVELKYRGTVSGDRIDGVVGNPRGEIPFTGERITTQ